MKANTNNNGSDFKSPDEAFEYLLNQRLDEKRKKEWAKALGDGPEQESQKKKTISKTLLIRLMSAAAVVILIAGFFLFTQNTKPLNQYAGDLLQETNISISYGSETRGANTSNTEIEIKTLKNELTTVLLNEDFNQALGYFRQLEKMSSLSLEDKYYFAASLLKTKGEDCQKAIRLLNDVVAEDDFRIENALWLRALAYGMTDNSPLMKKDLAKLNSLSTKSDKRVKDLLSKY